MTGSTLHPFLIGRNSQAQMTIILCFFQARAFLLAAASLAPHMYEPHYNHGLLSHKVCDYLLDYTQLYRLGTNEID